MGKEQIMLTSPLQACSTQLAIYLYAWPKRQFNLIDLYTAFSIYSFSIDPTYPITIFYIYDINNFHLIYQTERHTTIHCGMDSEKKVLLKLFKLQMYLDLEADWLVTTWYRKTPLYTSWAQLSKYISYVFVLNNNI